MGQSALCRQVMILSSIVAVDTQEYGGFDENASRRFHRNRHTCRNGLTDYREGNAAIFSHKVTRGDTPSYFGLTGKYRSYPETTEVLRGKGRCVFYYLDFFNGHKPA
jgi:hypothetical protein